MKAAYFRGDGIIELTDASKPEPGAGEVLIRVAANGVCGSDHKILTKGFKHIPGHEVVGTVVEAGPECTMPVGTRVAVYIPMHCGECRYCQQGAGNLCPHKKGLLGWANDGGYAEFMRLPERNALPLDDNVTFAEGVVLLDTLGTSGHALRLAHVPELAQTGQMGSALVIGAGPVGIGAVAMLKAFGVARVYASEFATYRREFVTQLGAIPIDPGAEDVAGRIRGSERYGVDLVFEAAGTWPTIQQSLDLVRPGGTVNLVGEHWGEIALDRPKGVWMINDITLIRSFYFTIPEFYENQQMVLGSANSSTVDAASLASHTFPLDDIRAAYDLFGAGKAIKALVTP